jgi:hypothetical protein
MKQVSHKPVGLIAPENIEMVSIDSLNGLRTDSSCPTARSYPYLIGSAPTDSSSCTASTVDETGGSISDPADENSVEVEPNTESSDNPVNSDSEPVAPPPVPTKSWFNNLF